MEQRFYIEFPIFCYELEYSFWIIMRMGFEIHFQRIMIIIQRILSSLM